MPHREMVPGATFGPVNPGSSWPSARLPPSHGAQYPLAADPFARDSMTGVSLLGSATAASAPLMAPEPAHSAMPRRTPVPVNQTSMHVDVPASKPLSARSLMPTSSNTPPSNLSCMLIVTVKDGNGYKQETLVFNKDDITDPPNLCFSQGTGREGVAALAAFWTAAPGAPWHTLTDAEKLDRLPAIKGHAIPINLWKDLYGYLSGSKDRPRTWETAGRRVLENKPVFDEWERSANDEVFWAQFPGKMPKSVLSFVQVRQTLQAQRTTRDRRDYAEAILRYPLDSTEFANLFKQVGSSKPLTKSSTIAERYRELLVKDVKKRSDFNHLFCYHGRLGRRIMKDPVHILDRLAELRRDGLA
ncbi:hypothetical protein FB45DRAFT_929484 [Roridomyces roridus]|uniref:Uncharacterized protein n=1 Tax=Roridomyces roridus TaxID=1738132 RepID=A0AAD7BG63_9AGAR|nr:hypothetical protein FB45DRAFT_929484 [Roridomyces roridus]